MIEVSVVIPVYNEEKYIEQCLKSLIAQTYPREKMEWIFIDGGSKDKSVDIIMSYRDEYPIKLLINPKRKTPISLNIGIQESVGEYIVRFDAHASFPSEYIENCISELKRTGAENVGGGVETKANGYIGEGIASILSSKFGVGGSAFRTGERSGVVDTVPFGAFRREVFDKMGLFNEELLRSEDNDINARIREQGGKVYLSEQIHSTYYCRDSIPSLLKMGLQNGNALFWTIKVNKKAMSIRHFIPFLFVASIILLSCLSGIKVFGYLLMAELVLYFLLDFYFSFVKIGMKYGPITFLLFPLFHVSYGLGSLFSLFGIKVY